MPSPDLFLVRKVVDLLDLERKAASKPRRPGQPQFAKATRQVARRLDRLAAQLARGDIDLDQYVAQGLEALEDGHAVSSSLGRRRAGDPAMLGSEDNLRASLVMKEEREYFEAFVQQIREGDSRYADEDGNLDAQRIASRSRNYLGKLRGTANASFLDASTDEDLFDRVMLTTEHCSTCPAKQGGPYSRSELRLIGIPGDGRDECRQNCGCVLVRYDGIVGFGRYTERAPRIKPGQLPEPDSDDLPDVEVIDIDHDDPALTDWFVT
jgi:hypothetical protein